MNKRNCLYCNTEYEDDLSVYACGMTYDHPYCKECESMESGILNLIHTAPSEEAKQAAYQLLKRFYRPD